MNERFHEERASCVGGSDLADLIQLPPYGCRRRLWYAKKGGAPDFPFLGNPATERGIALEWHAAHDFAREMPFDLSLQSPSFRALPGGFSMIACHADRLVYERGDMPSRNPGLHADPIGILEIKCPGARAYYSGRSSVDPPNEAKLQAIWCATIWGTDRAWVQWFSGDAWRSRFWEVPAADFELFDPMKEAAVRLWESLALDAPPYDRLDDGDARCNKCPWRGRCKGMGLGDDDGEPTEHGLRNLVPLALADVAHADRVALSFLATKRRLADAKEAHAVAKEELMSLLAGPGVAEVPSGQIKLIESYRKGYTRTIGPSTVRLLSFKPVRPEESDDGAIEIDDE